MFFFAGLDSKTVLKYLELRTLAEDKKREEARKAEQLRIAARYFAPRFIMPIPGMPSPYSVALGNKGSDGKLK